MADKFVDPVQLNQMPLPKAAPVAAPFVPPPGSLAETLMKKGAPKPGDLSDLPLPSKADFDRDRAKAADAETLKQKNQAAQDAAAKGMTGEDVQRVYDAVPAIKPEQMGTNPALAQDLQHANKGDVPPAIVDLKDPEGTAQSKLVYGDNGVPAGEQAPAPADLVPTGPPPAVEPPAPTETPGAGGSGEDSATPGSDAPGPEAPPPAPPAGRPTDVGGINGSDVKAVDKATSGSDLKKKILDIAQKTGVGLLDVLQAFAHGKSGDTGPTRLGQQISAETAAKAKKLEQEYMTNLEEKRNALQEKLQGSSQEFQAGQAEKAQTFASGQAEKAQAFQGTQAEKKEGWDKARADAQLAWEKEHGASQEKTQLDIARINADASKKYYEMMYGSGAGGGAVGASKVASVVNNLTGTGAPAAAKAAQPVAPNGKKLYGPGF